MGCQSDSCLPAGARLESEMEGVNNIPKEHSRRGTQETDAGIGSKDITHGRWSRAPHWATGHLACVCETPMEGGLPGKAGSLCRFVGKCRFSFVEVGLLDSRLTASWGTPWVAPGWEGGSEKKM